MLRLKRGKVVIVVGPDLDEFAAEVKAASERRETITITPLWHGDDKGGEILPEPVTIDPRDVEELSETDGPFIRADGTRMPQRWWWGGP